MPKSWTAAVAAGALAWLVLDPSVAAAAPTHPQTGTSASRRAPGWFAQAPIPRRPRTRIIVRPREPATGIYPSPLPYAYPGPNAVRDCASRLVVENRPSGPVLFPRMYCWWTTQ